MQRRGSKILDRCSFHELCVIWQQNFASFFVRKSRTIRSDKGIKANFLLWHRLNFEKRNLKKNSHTFVMWTLKNSRGKLLLLTERSLYVKFTIEKSRLNYRQICSAKSLVFHLISTPDATVNKIKSAPTGRVNTAHSHLAQFTNSNEWFCPIYSG